MYSINSFPTKLLRFPQGMSERAFQEPKKPKSSSPEHNFSPINNPEIVLEISAVPEYFDIICIRLVRKIEKSVFVIVKKGKMFTRKPLFFIFINKQIKILPNYSGTAEISKTVFGFFIEYKLWS